jgi:hypothetical protein
LIGKIIAAYKQTDATVRTTEIKDCQPQIVSWLIKNKMAVPTPEELNITGVLAAQKALEKVSEKGNVDTKKTGRLYKFFKHFHKRLGSIVNLKIREIEPDRLNWIGTEVIPSLTTLQPTQWTADLTVKPAEILHMLLGTKRSAGDARKQGEDYTESELDKYNEHAPKEHRIFSKGNKHDFHTIPEVWSWITREPVPSKGLLQTSDAFPFPPAALTDDRVKQLLRWFPMVADFHILSRDPPGFDFLVEIGVNRTKVQNLAKDWKDRVSKHSRTHQMFLATSVVSSVSLTNVAKISELQRELKESKNDEEYEQVDTVSEEQLVEMEKASQALQALRSYQYVMDLYQGFPEKCKSELGFCVDDELLAMIVSGRKLTDERKSALGQKLKTVAELSGIMSPKRKNETQYQKSPKVVKTELSANRDFQIAPAAEGQALVRQNPRRSPSPQGSAPGKSPATNHRDGFASTRTQPTGADTEPPRLGNAARARTEIRIAIEVERGKAKAKVRAEIDSHFTAGTETDKLRPDDLDSYKIQSDITPSDFEEYVQYLQKLQQDECFREFDKERNIIQPLFDQWNQFDQWMRDIGGSMDHKDDSKSLRVARVSLLLRTTASWAHAIDFYQRLAPDDMDSKAEYTTSLTFGADITTDGDGLAKQQYGQGVSGHTTSQCETVVPVVQIGASIQVNGSGGSVLENTSHGNTEISTSETTGVTRETTHTRPDVGAYETGSLCSGAGHIKRRRTVPTEVSVVCEPEKEADKNQMFESDASSVTSSMGEFEHTEFGEDRSQYSRVSAISKTEHTEFGEDRSQYSRVSAISRTEPNSTDERRTSLEGSDVQAVTGEATDETGVTKRQKTQKTIQSYFPSPVRHGATDLLGRVHDTEGGRKIEASTSRLQGESRQRSGVESKTQARRHIVVAGPDSTGRQVLANRSEGLLSPVRSVVRTAADVTCTPMDEVEPGDASGIEGSIGKDGPEIRMAPSESTEHNAGAGFLRKSGDNNRGAGSTYEVGTGHGMQNQDQDRRRTGDCSERHQRSNSTDVASKLDAGPAGGYIQTGERSLRPSTPSGVVRKSDLQYCSSDFRPGRQDFEKDHDDLKTQGTAAFAGRCTDDPRDLQGTGKSPFKPGLDSVTTTALDGDGMAEEAPATGVLPSIRMGRGDSLQVSSNRNSASCGVRMRRLDPRLRRKASAPTPVQRQAELQRTASGDSSYGRVRPTEGHIRGSGSTTRGNQSTGDIHGENGTGTHNPSRTGCGSKGASAHDRNEGLYPLFYSVENRCHGGSGSGKKDGQQKETAVRDSSPAGCLLQEEKSSGAGFSHSRSSQREGGLEQQTSFGGERVDAESSDVQHAESQMGTLRSGRICRSMELPDRQISDDGSIRQESSGSRFYDTCTQLRTTDHLGIPATVKKETESVGGEACVGTSTLDSDLAVVADGGNKFGDQTFKRFPSGIGMHTALTGTTGSLPGAPATGAGQSSFMVDFKDLQGICRFQYCRQGQLDRGIPAVLADSVDSRFKPDKTGNTGGHLDAAWSLFVATFKEVYGSDKVDIRSDTVLISVMSHAQLPQRAAEGKLSAMRVIMQTAHGQLPALKYDTILAKQYYSKAARYKAKTKRYSLAVDLLQVFIKIQYEMNAIRQMQDTARYKLKMLIKISLFLNRHDRVSRGDDEFKHDSRDPEYRNNYDGDGNLLTDGDGADPMTRLYLQLQKVIETDGYTMVRYFKPKDPRKTGDWSDWVTYRPLQISLLVDPDVPHLSNEQKVADLCAHRVELELVRVQMVLGRQTKMPAGHWYHSHVIKDSANKVNFIPLGAQRCNTLVVELMESANYKVKNNETDDKEMNSTEVLAGHFLRGHAGSVAYFLATKHGAAWNPLIGIDRARHTLNSFFSSYARGVCIRVEVKFNRHQRKSELRFETASRL